MSKYKIPKNREELFFTFQQAAAKQIRENPDQAIQEFLIELLPELIEEVPSAAFDPLQAFDEGILFYHHEVNEEEVKEFQHDLMRVHLNLPKGVPITLHLSSVGGSVFSGLALISTIYEIQRAGRKVNVHIQGVAMSMGSVIAQVANRRTIEAGAFFMIHEVSYQMRGSTADHEEERQFTTKLQDVLYQHYSARTGKPLEFYQEKLRRRNWYMTAEEALEEGLVDEIIPAPIYRFEAESVVVPEPIVIRKTPRKKVK